VGFQAPRGQFEISKVAIIDLGIGNLFSITCALKKIGLEAEVTSSKQSLPDVDAVVLPGVGNFKEGSWNLRLLKPKIAQLVKSGIPLFGICLGMQLLFEDSEEGPGKGLSLLEGKVLRLPQQVKTPHMGWNTLKTVKSCDLLDGISENDYFYFVHSYYASPTDGDVVVAETDYGLNFASVVASKNIYGAQFHPEKSGEPGKQILRSFVKIVKR